ncbi:aryl-sulfate sulfotransferase (plasmid) [Halobaculum sp. CBA1158]|uniref:arylsulfotransferase family protein n=1 Tax=Halobaculum sp. CBA1158 TaxID=2904243 RepID=UPI001F2F90E3|nr:arylsulfotransferase family protein [Halobaculum sp. CBA1158]UIP01600.1 aryl-sulfate sulfotransferase [Halobaculum sp. CBA1158]
MPKNSIVPEAGNQLPSTSRGSLLILAGILLLVGTLTVSAVLAPSIGQTDASDHQSLTLVGSQGGGPGWHEYGSVYLLNGTTVTWSESSADSYFDVTKTENGTVLAGFMDSGYVSCGPYESPCTRTGFRVIDPQPGPRVLSEYSFPVRTSKNSEVHDVEQLESGEYLLTDMEYERIFTVKDGEVTWQWNASSFYDAPPDPTTTDWLHINDVDVIDEGRYLVSVRNANQLVVVERGEGVVEVINKDTTDSNDANCRKSGQLTDYDGDGQIRCGDPTVLDHQHNPQWLGEDAVLVADSENDRVVELHQTANGSWTPAWTLERAGGVAFNWPRDADRLPNGNTLITDTLNRRIVEVNESGEVVWSVQTERIPYEADRLPVGESVGAPQYATDSGSNNTPSDDVPVLSLMLVGLRAVFPSTPFWFREPQLGLTILSVLSVLVGIVDELSR